LISAVALTQAQESALSPPASVSVELKGKQVKIDYCRPSMRGRKIVGGLVPYGTVWRTGANDATSLVTGIDLFFGDAKVPAGKYTIYTLPAEDSWKLIINKQTGQWGTEYDESQDLVRIDLSKSVLKSPIEQITIKFDKTGGDKADLVMEWEKTRLVVPVRAQ